MSNDQASRSNAVAGGAQSAPAPSTASASPGKQTLSEEGAEAEQAGPAPSLTLGKGGGAPVAPAAGAAPAAAAGTGQITVNNWNTAPGNPSRTRTRVGVGESVELSTQGSGGTWSSTRSFPGSAPMASSGGRSRYMWQAPDTAGSATITYTPAGGAARTIEMQVVAPTAVAFTNQAPMGGIVNAGAGMRNNVEIGPRDVSFENAYWKEDAGASAQPRAVQGYFQRFRANGGDLVHHPNLDWLAMDSLLNDEAGISGLPPHEDGQWSDGSFHWDIPNRYTIDRAAAGHVFANVQQSFRITQNGAVTVGKGAQSVTGMPRPAGSAAGASAESREEFRTLLRGESLELQLDRLRAAPDEPTRALIREVITEREPVIKITIKCRNSYSWIGADSVLITVNNRPTRHGTISIDTNQTRTDTIGFWGAYDLSRIERGRVPPLDINVRAEGHDLRTIIHAMFRDSDFADLNERYQLKYELIGARGANVGGGATGDI